MSVSLKINVIKDKILSDNYFILRNITYEVATGDEPPIRHIREVYDRGNGATMLQTAATESRFGSRANA